MRKVPKLRFKEFSDEWEEKKLGDLILLQRGSSPRPIIKYITNSSDGVNWIKIGDTNKESKYITSTSEKITKEGAKKSREVKKGEIILSNSMSYGRPFILKIDGYIHDGWFVIRKYEENFNKEFLCQLLGSDFVQLQYKKVAAGGVVENISSELVNSVKVKVLSLKEQEKIANFLSNIDKKISLTEEKLELFREYKKGVMQKIFSQELRFKDSDDNDYPEWEEKKLEEVAECLDNLRKPLNSNEREKIKGSIPYYGANGIQGYINNYIFNEELVLLAEDGGNFDDYLTKPIAQYVQGKSWINNHAHVLKGKKVLKTKFLYFSLVHKDIRSFINGTSRSKLNKSSMLNIIILLPALEEQEKIADFLSSIDSKIENIEKELEGLKEFKKGLLQQMFI